MLFPVCTYIDLQQRPDLRCRKGRLAYQLIKKMPAFMDQHRKLGNAYGWKMCRPHTQKFPFMTLHTGKSVFLTKECIMYSQFYGIRLMGMCG
ncbi:hypothetical protein D9M68_816260 [compost metagenome]